MINLINTYVEMQKKLDAEYGIIAVSSSYQRPRVQIDSRFNLGKFLEIGKGNEIIVKEVDRDEYPYEAFFIKNNIEFITVLDQGKYEEIIKIEGVTHE